MTHNSPGARERSFVRLCEPPFHFYCAEMQEARSWRCDSELVVWTDTDLFPNESDKEERVRSLEFNNRLGFGHR